MEDAVLVVAVGVVAIVVERVVAALSRRPPRSSRHTALMARPRHGVAGRDRLAHVLGGDREEVAKA